MKNFTICKCLLFAAAVCVSASSAVAQNSASVDFKGSVTTSDGGGAVPFAVVTINDLKMSTITNNDGDYSFKKVAPDTYEITVSSLGFETLTTTINVNSKQTSFDFTLTPADFYIDDVVVTARASKAGASTASSISRTAMDHMQMNSLADVMALLPGADIASSNFKPDLQGVKTQSIRGAQAMGTAIILDGAPLSNNANMQTMSGAMGGGGTDAGGIAPASGIDLRTITTDNIESVEVIRGVASVEYGDATSGAVIVNAKAGREPLTVRFQTNPNVYSIGATQGFGLGDKSGFINYGLDYAYSVSNPRESYDTYQRSTARIAYSNTFFQGKLSTNSAVTFNWDKTKGEPNPDDDSDYETKNQKNIGFRITTGGTWNANKGWFKNIKYNVAFGYTDRQSYYQDLASNGDVAYSYVKEDGVTLSSGKGLRFYDKSGNELTNFDANKYGDQRSWYTPSEYLYEYNVYGKELNTYAKVVANFAGKIGATNHRFIVGADFKSDGNNGRGKVFDMDTPPYRSVSYQFATQRERAYKDIPFLNQLGVYAEETFRATILDREFNATVGARYDHVFDFKGILTPRVNASYEIIPGMLSIRGAYGETAKTPSLAYLYPDKAFFDMTNFNSATATDNPDQQFQVITTHVYDSENPDLEMMKQTKYELGIDFNWKKMNFSITAYKDFSHNGYTFSRTLNSTKWVDYTKYKAYRTGYDADWNPVYEVNPTNNSLYLQVSSEDKYFLQYTTPSNNAAYERKGLEFVMDFGRIDAIRTSFVLNGELYDEKGWNNGITFYNTEGDGTTDYGIYSSKITGGISREQNLITNLIITHNIPQIGFVVSLTANVNWRYKSWTTYEADDTVPMSYLSIADGQVHDFDPAWANTASADYATYSHIIRNEANGAVKPTRFMIEPSYKPVLCMNVNVTKQFEKFDVSFYANNMFRSTPLQKSVVNPGTYYRRNGSVFFFGLQLTARFN